MRRLVFPVALLAFCFCLVAHVRADDKPLTVVAGFSLLADMVREIAGPDVLVETLVGPDQDAHAYQPTPDDMKKLANADIIAINGLGFEGWMDRLISASETKAKLLVASAGVKLRALNADEARDHRHRGEHQGDEIPDPHAWQNLRNAEIYARNIAGAIIHARPSLAEETRARLKDYVARIKALDAQLRDAFAAVPPERRKIVTSHDAFGYFGDAYGVTFLSPVGLSTETEPSAADMARLVEEIKAEGVTKLFAENMASPRLVRQLAREAGVTLGGELYADALSRPDGPAPTYLDMMRHNAHEMLGAMK